jgi:hypothetical protein
MEAVVRATDLDPFEIRDDRWEVRAKDIPQVEPNRLAFAAAHVVMSSSYAAIDHAPDRPGDGSAIASHIDWDATLDVRHHLASHGLGIAEAMDTAQRFELGWPVARELIRRTGEAALDFVAGAGYDHRDNVGTTSALIDAVVEQVHEIQRAGGKAVLLPMPLLTALGADEQAVVDVYTTIIDQCEGPLIVHWLGEVFLPAMKGYFPGESFLRVMRHDPDTVRAAKLSLLDADRERQLRRELAKHDQLMLTGDDFNFGTLMTDSFHVERMVPFGKDDVPLGDFSHALLGIFDGMPAVAGLALRALAAERHEDAAVLLRQSEALGRMIFQQPTYLYKCGLAFLAWVNGVQDVFDLPNHLQRARDRNWYADVLRTASDCGAITDAPMAAERALYVLK